ncbi:MAG: DUF4105 domain-containing protein [Bacteroidales bacterium]|nr:DUF4105 domain-containing protein [Bacteroidales bacterium]
MKGFIPLLLIVFFVAYTDLLRAQAVQYGDSVEVSLLTCEPGDAVYARFGHSALRIRDAGGRDMSYNYGIFDFRTTNFYWKFLRGQTDYLLGVYPTEYFLAEYRERGSVVWEQVLNLTAPEKQKLIDLLNENYRPENRMYRYNFVFDNCATRPKVMVQDALDGRLSYESAYAADTYRQLINDYISNDAWLYMGINLVFGASADQTVGKGGASFLPELLRNDMQRASIVGGAGDSRPRPFVKSTQMAVGPFATVVETTPWWMHPLFISVVVFFAGLALTLQRHKNSRTSKLFDSVLYGLTALGGVIIFLLSFFSEHPLVEANWNLLWLNPLNLLPAILIWQRKARKFLLYYHSANVLMQLAAGVVMVLQVQQFPVAVFPLVLLLLLRTSRRIKRLFTQLLERSTNGWKWKK